LGFLNGQNAINLFKKYYLLDKLIDQDIKNLVEIVDYHTLTIEILAKTAQVQRYNAATLKLAVEKDLRANIEIAHNKVLGRIEKVGSYLRTVFSLSKLSENEIWLLKQFACLPPDFHTYDTLKVLLINEESAYKEIFNETLANISQKGWLLRNIATDSFKLHRVISEVLKTEQPIQMTDVHQLIRSNSERLIIDQTKVHPIEKFEWIPFGKALLANFEGVLSTEIGDLKSKLGLRLREYGD